MKISIIKDKHGINDILYLNDLPVYSIYSLEKNIKRQIDTQLKSNVKNIIVFGIGLGYHLKYILEKFQSVNIFVFEPQKEIAALFKEKYATAANINFEIYCYDSLQELSFLLDQKIEYKNMSWLAIFNSYQNTSLFDKMFGEFIYAVRSVIESKHKNFWTTLMLSEQWHSNIAENFKYLTGSFPVNSLFKKFGGAPALIVGAGPSLDKSISDIKRFADRFIIICVDTALRSLIKNEIIPDIVVTLDAQKTNFKDFTGVCNFDFFLVYDITVYPEILNWYRGEKKFCSIIGQHCRSAANKEYLKIDPLYEFLKNYISDTGYLQTGGSVSTVALDLARNMGCDPIIFVGQDLSFSDYKTHSADSYDIIDYLNLQNKFMTVETQIFNFFEERSLFSVKGNYSEFVFTDLSLKHYLNWISDAAAVMPQKIINATAGGAFIPNTILMPLAEAAVSFQLIDKSKLFANLSFSKIKVEKNKLKNTLEANLKKFSIISDEIQNCIELIDKDMDSTQAFNIQQLKNSLLNIDFSFFETYKNQYYLSLKQLDSLDIDEKKHYQYDNKLLFMIMLDAIKKICVIFKKIFD